MRQQIRTLGNGPSPEALEARRAARCAIVFRGRAALKSRSAICSGQIGAGKPWFAAQPAVSFDEALDIIGERGNGSLSAAAKDPFRIGGQPRRWIIRLFDKTIGLTPIPEHHRGIVVSAGGSNRLA